jgi:hypothetical protein
VRVGWFAPPGPATKLLLIPARPGDPGQGRDFVLGRDLVLGREGGCGVIEWNGLELGAGAARVRLEASREGVFDYVEVEEAH